MSSFGSDDFYFYSKRNYYRSLKLFNSKNWFTSQTGYDKLGPMKTADLDYDLPPERIAQSPMADRSASRLLVLDRQSGRIEHRVFADIVDYTQPGDCLVLNDSKVIPAQFTLRRKTGGLIEGLFLSKMPENQWRVLLKNAGRMKPLEKVRLFDTQNETESDFTITVSDKLGEGQWLLTPETGSTHLDILSHYGQTPLPPYIHRKGQHSDDTFDRQHYQTVYAQQPGSVAAPTAGLHFTSDLLDRLERRGLSIAKITLHVGLGTFKPISDETVEAHQMHHETFQIDPANADRINQAKSAGKRIIATGTTSVRTLEAGAVDNRLSAKTGQTDIFIKPGCSFQIVDALITNFHLPRSTLLALVFAFAGREFVLETYRQAVQMEYRFFSYGDAMLIL